MSHYIEWKIPDTDSKGINSLAPGRFYWNIISIIFNPILVIDDWGISCEITLKWLSLDLSDNRSTLVQVMIWCHPLSQCWSRSMLTCGVTKLQWVDLQSNCCKNFIRNNDYIRAQMKMQFYTYRPCKLSNIVFQRFQRCVGTYFAHCLRSCEWVSQQMKDFTYVKSSPISWDLTWSEKHLPLVATLHDLRNYIPLAKALHDWRQHLPLTENIHDLRQHLPLAETSHDLRQHLPSAENLHDVSDHEIR